LQGFYTFLALEMQLPPPGQVQTVQIEPSLPHNLIVSADYQYQGKHYKYKYSGKYYDHRSQQNGKWRYY
jgi:hypothetical protein